MSLGLKLYLKAALRAGERARLFASADDTSSLARPAGKILWLHISCGEEIPPIQELIHQFADEAPEVSFLVTLPAGTASTVNFQQHCIQPCIQITAPADTPQQVVEFLKHWRPALAIWAGAVLRPALVIGAAQRGIPLLMVNAHAGATAEIGNFWNRGMIRPLIQHFGTILAGTIDTANLLVRQGANPGNVTVSGLLQEGTAAPPSDDGERDELAASLATRPVWLALGSSISESKMISEAHRAASRLSHRLLLVISARDPDHGAVLSMVLADGGWRLARHSQGQKPEEDTQIFIADSGDDSDLWLGLSQVCFLGNSLHKRGTGCAPFDALAFGSAILHGRYVSGYKECYDQLDNMGAARVVHTANELSAAVQELLAPDKAAVMAHAGWEMISARAETTRRVVGLIQSKLDERESA